MTPRDCLDEAFRRLSRGVADRRHAFHTPTFATIGPDGAPEARTLVLRGFDAAARTIRLHSDARSGKVVALLRDPRCALHLYDAGAKLQIRLSGAAEVLGDERAEAAWQASRDFSRMCYAIEPGPGTPVAEPPPAPRDAEAGRPHFRVIAMVFDVMDWLELAHDGHRRARFDWRAGALRSDWLVP
ncbi:pyridoxamine 5'-phosphate oxidase family protein [Falsiroseomonas sp. HW251]|uniref:pyridoxamine 5'-phosphate oxidase family protein n=1 Tax=Falsiroseomonas sp. HW251 TaxID=3390998 RepID=UPI003D3219D1